MALLNVAFTERDPYILGVLLLCSICSLVAFLKESGRVALLVGPIASPCLVLCY